MLDNAEPDMLISNSSAYTIKGETLRQIAQTLSEAGKKILAIKLIREATGEDLRTAKDFVESGCRTAPLEPGHTLYERLGFGGTYCTILGSYNHNGEVYYWVKPSDEVPCTFSAASLRTRAPHGWNR